MSLINDALRRASQTEKERPRPAPTPMGMEPVPQARGSRLTLVLASVVLAALILAGWFFRQWWIARNTSNRTVVAASIAPPMTPRVVPQPVVAPKPVPVAPAAPVNPAPAPVVVPATLVAASPVPAQPVAVPIIAAPPVVAQPVAPPIVARDDHVPWPVDLTLSAVFFSKTNPRALINGSLYEVGDAIQGVVLKKIEKAEVTVEWNGHSKILMMGDHP